MTDLRTPAEWEKELDVIVVDPDGWDRTNFEEDWAKPISREEFNQKLGRSSVTDLGAVARALGWASEETIENSRHHNPDKTWEEIIAEREQSSYDPLLPAARPQRGQHVRR